MNYFTRREFTEEGREVADQTPIAIPAGWDRPESLQDQIKRLIRVQLSRQALEMGQESFEESDDFDIPDESGDFVSPYEVREMEPEALGGPDPDSGGGSTTPPVKSAPEGSTQASGASAAADVAANPKG